MTEPTNETGAAQPEMAPVDPAQAETASAVDPMKGFRGVMAGTLVLEAIVVALALLVVTCALLRHSWSVWVIGVAQLALIGCAFGSPAVAAIGVLFALVWGWLLWARRDVARRMAAGRLPGQRPSERSE